MPVGVRLRLGLTKLRAALTAGGGGTTPGYQGLCCVSLHLSRRMPSCVRPKFAADRGIRNHEADRVGDFQGPNQSSQLRIRKHILLDEIFSQTADHRGIGESGWMIPQRTP